MRGNLPPFSSPSDPHTQSCNSHTPMGQASDEAISETWNLQGQASRRSGGGGRLGGALWESAPCAGG